MKIEKGVYEKDEKRKKNIYVYKKCPKINARNNTLSTVEILRELRDTLFKRGRKQNEERTNIVFRLKVHLPCHGTPPTPIDSRRKEG